jgi:N-acetylmuramoyl-L-alanine amidase
MSESTITLAVAEALKGELAKDRNFTPILTRTTDTYVSLENRARLANAEGDVFISIHVNSNTDTKARGKEIYFQNQLDADEESLFLANAENSKELAATAPADRHQARSVSLALAGHDNVNADVRSIVEDLERNQRLKMSGLLTEELHRHWGGDAIHRKQTIRQAPFYVISNVSKPAALIEIGFLTNPAEAQRLIDPNYQKHVAHGIYEALIKFKEVVDKATPHHLN